MAKAYVAELRDAERRGRHPDPRRLGLHQGLRGERGWRDAKLTSLGGGTTEIQKVIISRMLLA